MSSKILTMAAVALSFTLLAPGVNLAELTRPSDSGHASTLLQVSRSKSKRRTAKRTAKRRA